MKEQIEEPVSRKASILSWKIKRMVNAKIAQRVNLKRKTRCRMGVFAMLIRRLKRSLNHRNRRLRKDRKAVVKKERRRRIQ